MAPTCAVFSDIDYTIVFDSELDGITASLIQEVRERAPFVLVTARSLAECTSLPPIPNDGLVAENGAVIYIREGDDDLLDAEWDAVMSVRQQVLVDFRVSLVDRGWRVNKKLHAFSACIEASGMSAPDVAWVEASLPSGLCLEFSRNTAGRYIEVFPVEAGKDKAVHRVCGRLGVPLEGSFGLGDNTNDLSMLRAVSVPLCPGNAHEEVKRVVAERGGYVSAHGGHAGAQDILGAVLQKMQGGRGDE